MLQPDIPTYLTFDDVILLPGFSEILPSEGDISTQLTRNIRLNSPLLSAPMDTVTEASMAIALAQEGGVGIIHRNMEAKQQRKEIERVKRAVSIMIPDPITLRPEQKINEALDLFVYNFVALKILNPNFEVLEKNMAGVEAKPLKKVNKPYKIRREGSFVNGFR